MSCLTRVVARSRADVASAIASSPPGARVLLLFCGEKGAGGESWCSDCVEAEPALDAALAESAAERPILVVDVPLPRAEFKGVASHWARAAPFGVGRVPALCRWGAAKVTAAIFEDECKSKANVLEFLAE